MIAGLLVLVTLLVGSGLGLVGLTLFLVQGLPSLTQNLADLTCRRDDEHQHDGRKERIRQVGRSYRS